MLRLDSSLFIRWGRQGQSAAPLIRPYLTAGKLMTCGVVRAEVLRGVKSPPQSEELSVLFCVMNEVAITSQVWDRTISLAWTLDRQRKVLPLPDIIIAACTLEAGAAIVIHDTHFTQIPGLTVHPDLP